MVVGLGCCPTHTLPLAEEGALVALLMAANAVGWLLAKFALEVHIMIRLLMNPSSTFIHIIIS